MENYKDEISGNIFVTISILLVWNLKCFTQLENSNTYVSVYKNLFDYDNKIKARTNPEVILMVMLYTE